MKSAKRKVVLIGLTFFGLCSYGLWCLKAYAYMHKAIKNNYDIEILEFDVNEDIAKIVKEILKKKPNILGFTVHHGLGYKVLEISKLAGKQLGPVLTILGGTEVSNNSSEILKRNNYIDIIVRGEGEVTFGEILKKTASSHCDFRGIAGITYRDNRKVICNPDRESEKNLDAFPSPYLSNILKPERYEVIHIETYRGCPFKCRYCYEYRGFTDMRFFSTDRVKRELSFLLKKGVNRIKFFDTVFTWDKERIEKILKFLAEKNKNTRIYAETIGELLDESIIKLMRKSGFSSIEIGIQTINRTTLKNAGRTWNKEKFAKNIRSLLKNRITPIIHIMGGLPGDSLEDTKKAINYVFSLGAAPQLFLTRILSGSRFEKMVKDFNIKFLHYGLHDIISNSTYSAEDVIRYRNIMKAHSRCWTIINAIPTVAKELKITPADFYERLSLCRSGVSNREGSLVIEITEFLQKAYKVKPEKAKKLIEFIRYCEHEFKARESIYYGFERGKISRGVYALMRFDFDFSNLEVFYPNLINLQNVREKKTAILFIRRDKELKKIVLPTS